MKRDYPPVSLPPFVLLLLLSFCEGAAVMIVEISGAKMLAPLFGSSLQVWASVLGVTLLALAGGYFCGGILSKKEGAIRALFITLMMAGVCTSLMPMFAGSIIPYFLTMNFETAVVLAAAILLFAPVFLMGCFSPLMVEALGRNKKKADDRYTGLVFAVSTLGGITATFLWGFYLIPLYGLKTPVFITGIVLLLLSFASGRQHLSKYMLLASGVMMAPAALILLPNAAQSPYFKLVYESEGVLGQILVIDFMEKNESGEYTKSGRGLYFNRIIQAIEWKKEDTIKYSAYVEKLRSLVKEDLIKKRGKVLILGLGSGSLANVLIEEGFQVDAVEFDKRVSHVAKSYFNLHPSVRVIHDDARHYINTCSQLYDLIVADVFKAEENPPHIITRESLTALKSICKKNGVLVVNGYGFWDGEAGRGTRSIAKTLLNADYKVCRMQTERKQEDGNQLLIATAKHARYILPDTKQIIQAGADAEVLTDDRPLLDYLNREAVRTWRINYNRLSTSVQLQHGLQVFY